MTQQAAVHRNFPRKDPVGIEEFRSPVVKHAYKRSLEQLKQRVLIPATDMDILAMMTDPRTKGLWHGSKNVKQFEIFNNNKDEPMADRGKRLLRAAFKAQYDALGMAASSQAATKKASTMAIVSDGLTWEEESDEDDQPAPWDAELNAWRRHKFTKALLVEAHEQCIPKDMPMLDKMMHLDVGKILARPAFKEKWPVMHRLAMRFGPVTPATSFQEGMFSQAALSLWSKRGSLSDGKRKIEVMLRKAAPFCRELRAREKKAAEKAAARKAGPGSTLKRARTM